MTESSCSHPASKRSYTIDGKWSICDNCGESLIVVSDRENLLYEIFKARLMEELKIVGYRLVKIDPPGPEMTATEVIERTEKYHKDLGKHESPAQLLDRTRK